MTRVSATRVVVVSGGGTGIGLATAHRFAQDGDQVVIVGRRKDVLDKAATQIDKAARSASARSASARSGSARSGSARSGSAQSGSARSGSARSDVAAVPVLPIAADLAEPDEVESLAAVVRERFGRVDVLVNNAGGNVQMNPLSAPRDGLARAAQLWTDNFRINVLTAVLPTEAFTDLYSDQARVILLSSIAAFRGSGSGSYGGVKAALHPYAVDLSRSLGPRGITVNVVAPGFIDDTEFFANTMSDQSRATRIAETVTKRAGHVEDVAHTIHWLASPAAGHVTAQIIQVNGGALPGR